jgi:ketosteroid isomerase-like protein
LKFGFGERQWTSDQTTEGIMKEQDNIDLVRQCYEAFAKGDIQRLLGFFSQDIDWNLPEIEGIAFTGNRHGIDQVADFFQQMSAAQDANEFVPAEFIGQGDRVVVLGHCSWTAKATGLDYSDEFCHIFTVSGGKISNFKEFGNTHKAALAYQPKAGIGAAAGAGAAAGRPPVH